MNSIQFLSRQFELNTKLFRNVLDNISAEDSLKRITGQVNHLRWIAGHLLVTRYNAAQRLGYKVSEYPHLEKYAHKDKPPPNARAIDESIDYPDLQEIMKDWNNCSDFFIKAIASLNEEKYLVEGPFSSPLGGKTLLELMGFIALHESFHIGQMSIIRKGIGMSAMSFR